MYYICIGICIINADCIPTPRIMMSQQLARVNTVDKNIAKNSNYRNVSKRIVFFHIQLALASCFCEGEGEGKGAVKGEQ